MPCPQLKGYDHLDLLLHLTYFRACDSIAIDVLSPLKDALADQRFDIGELKYALKLCVGVVSGTFKVPAPIIEQDVECLYQWKPD